MTLACCVYDCNKKKVNKKQTRAFFNAFSSLVHRGVYALDGRDCRVSYRSFRFIRENENK
jgi:hypothetical protein